MSIRFGVNGQLVTKHAEEELKIVHEKQRDSLGMVELNALWRIPKMKQLVMSMHAQVQNNIKFRMNCSKSFSHENVKQYSKNFISK